MVDTETILDTAKYLRNVRPLDPDEIQEYTSAHPGVIRQVLREHAIKLEIVERSDGTFVPVSEDPVHVETRSVTEVPERYMRVLESLLVEEFGPGWPDGESGELLRSRIRQLKAAYYRQHPVEYDYRTALAYAIYHLPDYYATGCYLCQQLANGGLLNRTLRILDVGAGVGGPALGIADSLPADTLVEYTAIEPSSATGVLDAFLGETGPNFHKTIQQTTAEAFDPSGLYDLILFSNVLSELDDPVAVVDKYIDALAETGTMVLLAPADKNTSSTLRTVEQTIVDERNRATVHSPTVRLWPEERPTDTCWSFTVKPELSIPRVQSVLEEQAGGKDHTDGEFINRTVQYAYALLRRDELTIHPTISAEARWTKLADSEQHIGNRLDILAVKLSEDLADGGNPIFLVGDGSQRVDHFAVIPKITALNDTILESQYGTLLSIEGTLVLWNEDKEAVNLVVDDQTVIDVINPMS